VILRPLLTALLYLATAVIPALAQPDGRRPLLITVDDLPISSARLHPDPEERRRITETLLAALARHNIRAVGLVTWNNVRDDADRELLRLWLAAGHELGNHSRRHLNYTRTDPESYIADIEYCRGELSKLLAEEGTRSRFFRFPMLREGDTREKLDAMRSYLQESGQRNLPVTIDNQDWSFEAPWVEAQRAEDKGQLEVLRADFHAAMRLMVRHHERTGDRLFDREVPQILLLHATEVGAAMWDDLFTWLAKEGHRFADADEVLQDTALQEPHAYVGPFGLGFWDRLLTQRRLEEARQGIEAVLEQQATAWNNGDVEAFAAHYAEDALFLSISGLTRGRQAVVERYKRRYPDRAAMGTLSLELVDWRPATGTEFSLLGDARPGRVQGASVVARWRLTYPDKEALSGVTLLVLHPTGSGWEIVQDASM